MKLRKTLVFSFAFFFLLYGCKKSGSDGCPAMATIPVTVNSNTIIKGWGLSMSVPNHSPLYKFNWTGPSGWNQANAGTIITRSSMQASDGGTYKVQVYNAQGCLVEQGETTINIIDAPDAPCEGAVASNTSTSNVPNFGNMNFTYVSVSGSPVNNMRVRASNGNTGHEATLFCTFKGIQRPVPGIYKSSPYYDAPSDGEASIFLYDYNTATYLGFSSEGQDVYVTDVNGKIQICMCNIQVQSGPILYQLTAKITVNW